MKKHFLKFAYCDRIQTVGKHFLKLVYRDRMQTEGKHLIKLAYNGGEAFPKVGI